MWLYQADGSRLMDLISGIAVSSLGHRHPKVIQAIHAQSEKYLHLMVYGEFVEAPQVTLATKLTATLPDPIDGCFLVNAGGEAVEGAIKLVRKATGRSGLVCFDKAYHGSSTGALALVGDDKLKDGYGPLLPNVKRLCYNSPADLAQITSETAGVFVEAIQGEAGVRPATQAWMTALRQHCDQVGALLVCDEIQCGMGRTGKMWGFEHYGIVPDVVVSAKALGGGLPIGAILASQKLLSVFTDNPILGNISTFGGHPLSAAAAVAGLEVLEEENLIAQVEAKGKRFEEALKNHPKVKAVRRVGLMMAVQFSGFDELKPIIDRAIAAGLLTDWFLFCDDAMRLAPPLTITEEEIEWALEILLSVLATNEN